MERWRIGEGLRIYFPLAKGRACFEGLVNCAKYYKDLRKWTYENFTWASTVWRTRVILWHNKDKNLFRVSFKDTERREMADCEYRQFFQGVSHSREWNIRVVPGGKLDQDRFLGFGCWSWFYFQIENKACFWG